jgi:hypothetical protein
VWLWLCQDHLLLLLLNAERAWSYAMQIKQVRPEANP